MADENNKKQPSVDGEATKGFPILRFGETVDNPPPSGLPPQLSG